jgi:mannose-6-phosphate isomerase-like protein (cupin superfamily)
MSAAHSTPATTAVPTAVRTLRVLGPREPLHAHDEVTTIHVLEGVVYLVAEEDERALTPGDVASLAAGTPHRIFNAGDGDAVVAESAGLADSGTS